MFEPHAEKIVAAFIFGSVARGTDTARSDIDLMVIADGLNYDEVYVITDAARNELGRDVSPVLISSAEWRREVAMGEAFVSKVRSLPRLFLFGSDEHL